MAFVQREIEIIVQLGKGSFGQDGFNTITLTDYRMSVTIQKTGTPSMNTAEIRIFGMSQSLMNELSILGYITTAVRNNVVTVNAGDAGSAKSLAFVGVIATAYEDAQASPEVSFVITAFTGYLQQMQPILPSSYPGSTDVVTIMQGLAKQMGLTFENNGVNGVILASPYLPGTARQQAVEAADAAGIIVAFDDTTMSIFPVGGSRGGPIPMISATTGMVGYPVVAGPVQISVRSVYNQALKFMGLIDVQSIVPKATGRWQIIQLAHHLESQMPNGNWYSEMMCILPSDRLKAVDQAQVQ